MHGNLDIGIKCNYTFTTLSTYNASLILCVEMMRPKRQIPKIQEQLDAPTENQTKRDFARLMRDEDVIARHADKIKTREKSHNIVPNVVRFAFASLIAWNTVTPTFMAKYCVLWSWNTTPANTDTQLATETKRDIRTNKYSANNVAYLDKFRASSQVANLNFLECWTVIDGTITANTGFLFSRILINQSISATETLTINASFTIV